ncbi:hypothetical protein LPJGGPFB_05241 [Ensifer adhaerens]|uniref:Uncharacterized protein n=1 Tax=Ensifer adhaerens TaxID=106592 RepID=A0ACC5T5D4_ENSAD|nr:hypothetical protein [Ensifer adhaerens]NRP21982.1 hypothetical protein [Ensifer adhaerens]
MADVPRIVSHLQLSEPVALRNETTKPRRIVVQRKHADPLRRQLPLSSRQKRQQDVLRIVIEAGHSSAVALPFRDRHLQRLGVFLKIVIDDRKCEASLQVRETQARAPLGRIFVAVCHRAPRRTGICGENSVELAQQGLDHTALMHAATIAIADTNAIVIAAALERIPLEFLRRVRNEQFWPAEYRPGMVEVAGRKPRLFRAQGLGKAKCDRQDRRFFQCEADAENGPSRNLGDDR